MTGFRDAPVIEGQFTLDADDVFSFAPRSPSGSGGDAPSSDSGFPNGRRGGDLDDVYVFDTAPATAAAGGVTAAAAPTGDPLPGDGLTGAEPIPADLVADHLLI